MTDLLNFHSFPKIPRWQGSQHIIVTEKIDGTNAQIVINEDCTDLRAASRNRWISPDDDNYGFAAWAVANKEKLLTLGKGQHFGEWYGLGIGRNYGLQNRRFALFNTIRWTSPEQRARVLSVPNVETVPILYTGPLDNTILDDIMADLRRQGSCAVPGYGNPEGIIVYLPETKSLYKLTYDGPKWAQKVA